MTKSQFSGLLPFLTSLSGISRFNDLNSRLNAIKLSEAGKLNVVFVSFYEDFRLSFTKYADMHFLHKNINNIIYVRELHLFKRKREIEVSMQGRISTFAFDSVSSIETLALIIRILERGHQIHVFHPWIHRGKEKRSAFSILLRHCAEYYFAISSAEIDMWSEHAKERLRLLEVEQSAEFI